ncbi:hypothetical protein L665_02781 [Ralstonia solanacearum SD54]|nr:hypothetical protein L665_02781 [Ralstonia solanacearum SD54]
MRQRSVPQGRATGDGRSVEQRSRQAWASAVPRLKGGPAPYRARADLY